MPDRESAVQIREARAGDAETIARFVVAMAAETEGHQLDPDRTLQAVRTALADPNRACYWLALADGVPVGQLMITTEWSDWNNAWYWWVQSVYVQPQWRGRGVYRALYEHVKARAQERGDVCALRLYVLTENTSARRAYERLGMVEQPFRIYEQRLHTEPRR